MIQSLTLFLIIAISFYLLQITVSDETGWIKYKPNTSPLNIDRIMGRYNQLKF